MLMELLFFVLLAIMISISAAAAYSLFKRKRYLLALFILIVPPFPFAFIVRFAIFVFIVAIGFMIGGSSPMEVVFSITSTSPICMSVPKTTQGSRRRVLDRVNKINRIKNYEYR